jgi:DNA-binding NtrC family response regulator
MESTESAAISGPGAVAGPAPRKVLLVDDDTDLLSALSQLLQSEGYEVATAATAEDALEKFRDTTFHLVLTDLQLPGRNGIALIKALHEAAPATRCVLITGHGSIRSAVLALKRGAIEYVTKPIKPRRLLTLVAALTNDLPDYLPNKLLADEHGDIARLDGMVARSKVMREVFERVRLAAGADTTVLVTGESGTGKALVAAGIHKLSSRAAGPFVTVSTGTIPQDQVAGDLFDRLEQAEGGVLLIDEIAALDERTQVDLLRLFETGTLSRGKKDRPVDVRVIAGSNRDLSAAVAAGQLREDLFYRLNVFSIALPPLRQRAEDVPVLAMEFLRELAARYNKPITSIPATTEHLLTAYSWPGNVRELRNVIEQSVLLARGEELDPSLLPQMMHREPAPADVLRIAIGTTMETIEREVILRTLEANKGNKTATAEVLGISRRSIYNKLAEYEAQGSLPRSVQPSHH